MTTPQMCTGHGGSLGGQRQNRPELTKSTRPSGGARAAQELGLREGLQKLPFTGRPQGRAGGMRRAEHAMAPWDASPMPMGSDACLIWRAAEAARVTAVLPAAAQRAVKGHADVLEVVPLAREAEREPHGRGARRVLPVLHGAHAEGPHAALGRLAVRVPDLHAAVQEAQGAEREVHDGVPGVGDPPPRNDPRGGERPVEPLGEGLVADARGAKGPQSGHAEDGRGSQVGRGDDREGAAEGVPHEAHGEGLPRVLAHLRGHGPQGDEEPLHLRLHGEVGGEEARVHAAAAPVAPPLAAPHGVRDPVALRGGAPEGDDGLGPPGRVREPHEAATSVKADLKGSTALRPPALRHARQSHAPSAGPSQYAAAARWALATASDSL
eukprot:CAMPEP_0206005986 /NCGR_PEP_ID=MMETSP1464-20131121/4912_1 /ASSEMBLY_ACC=CAM_ASM_001124 /TAXON_ID=119497 /ORGANISM="Exanthemachrysis gayraliae, Strain RCC1523" /LENGTH=380 /DNA_ID=CAMNT_0053379449 /DNA_START=112 /DNA_END=1255 /DNA_ORIENTATION=+